MHGHWSERVLLNEQEECSRLLGAFLHHVSGPQILQKSRRRPAKSSCTFHAHAITIATTYVHMWLLASWNDPSSPLCAPELIYWFQVSIEKREASEASNCVTGSQQIKLLKF